MHSLLSNRKDNSIPLLMGIVNVTPDSFSDGGRFFSVDAAVEQAMKLIADGADIIDIGGESTRPGADDVDESEESRRVVPVIEKLRSQTTLPISIDTTKSEVARRALQAGATIINDISGLCFDQKMIDVCASCDCDIVCMHTQGTPKTMQINPAYSNVVVEVREFLQSRLEEMERTGISRDRVVVDPGIGFGKTAQHNLEILSNIAAFRTLSCPILIGHSRKRFLQKVTGRDLDERLFGTIGVSIALAEQGVDILRVHDVAANRDALIAWKTVRSMQLSRH